MFYRNICFMYIFTSLSCVRQLPLLCGLPFLERSASQTAHWIAGRSGKHLFLTDTDDGELPLLIRMVNDSKDIKFMLVFSLFSCVLFTFHFSDNLHVCVLCSSALGSFKRRVAYANANYDRILFKLILKHFIL